MTDELNPSPAPNDVPAADPAPDPGKAADDVVAAQAVAAKAAEDAAATKAADEAKKADEANKDDPKSTEYTRETVIIPDGVEVDEQLHGDFVILANKHGLSPEAVSDLVNLQTNAMKEASEKGSHLVDEQQETWAKETEADKDIGGDALDEHLGNISKLIDAFGGKRTDEIRAAFDFTGFGNHPAAVFFLSQVATELAEGRLIAGNPGSGERTAAETLYPSQGKT